MQFSDATDNRKSCYRGTRVRDKRPFRGWYTYPRPSEETALVSHSLPSRRAFLASTAATLTAAAAYAQAGPAQEPPELARPVPLGLDNFAVRASAWKAARLVEYAASLGCDSLFISDLESFEAAEDADLRALRMQAADAGVGLHVGMWSVCPTSKAFRTENGTADAQLANGIRIASAVGSPVLRIVLGTWEDRLTDGGIYRHIDSLVGVLKSARSRALDAGVRLAVENHAGDMRSEEVAALVEMAGRDFVGVNFDSGNALWTLEDPVDALERLAPYVVTTSLRDGVVTEIPTGARVRWTAMGDGQIDLPLFTQRFAVACPGVPIHVETISGVGRDLPFLDADFWEAWPRVDGSNLARFLRLMRRKAPMVPAMPKPNDAMDQRRELEKSLTYCRKSLGLGVRGTTRRPV
jgi:sugar phosphate isomerase/epimerase